MKKLLCPIDFSEISDNTTSYAAKIAQIANAELVLFHEHSLWSSPEEFITGGREAAEEIAEELEKQSVQISQAFHISCYADVIYSGKPLVTIIEEFANDFDLIIMGIDRETDLLKTIFGSMAFRVIQNTGTPLILVPEEYTYKKIDKIAFAFDPYEKRPTEINQLIEWAGYLKSDIQLLEGVKDTNADKSVVEELEGTPVISVDQIDRKELITEMHDYMQKGNADMIALYARDRGLFEKLFHKSVIRKLSVVADYPMLIFHN